MPVKPSAKEEEYFARIEFERKCKMAEEARANMAAAEKKKLQEMHHMCCPKCGLKLVAVDYRGIEIDKCTGCEGIWLDAGELEAVSKLDQGKLSNWFANFKK
ncbi:hypothetical protein JCM14469_37780 [Desulfatiferula olefinivorans]